jgi:hypothetical protein
MTEEDMEASSITVWWTKPGYDGGRPVIDYKVQIITTQEQNTSNTTHVIFSGLTKTNKYDVKVFARNVAGYGNPYVKIITTKKRKGILSLSVIVKSNM